MPDWPRQSWYQPAIDLRTNVHRLPLPPEEILTGTRRLNPSWRLLLFEVNLPPDVHPFLPTQLPTRFPFDGSDMTTGGARARRLLEDFAWSTRTIGSRLTQWKASQEFRGHEGRAIVPVNEGQLVEYEGWLAIEREAGRRSVSAASLPQYISAVRVVAKSNFDSQEALIPGRMPILQAALLITYGQWEARSFPRLTHRDGVPADIIQAIWANAMQSEERVVIRDAAAVILAYVLGLRESSVM
jgi:integrase